MHTHTRHDQWVTFETEKKTCLETRTINCLDNCFVYFATHWFVERCLSLLCLSPELNKVFKGGSWLLVHSISMGSLVFQNFLHPKIPFFAIQFFLFLLQRVAIWVLFKFHFRYTKKTNSKVLRLCTTKSEKRLCQKNAKQWEWNLNSIHFMIIVANWIKS